MVFIRVAATAAIVVGVIEVVKGGKNEGALEDNGCVVPNANNSPVTKATVNFCAGCECTRAVMSPLMAWLVLCCAEIVI